MILKMCADESYDPKTSLLQVAGYLMTEDQYIALEEAVQEIRGVLPYFHMRERHYKEHPEVYRKMISLVNPSSVIYGFCVSLHESAHRKFFSAKIRGQLLSYWMGKPYTYALGQIMAACSFIVGQSPYQDCLISYIFENGHPNQGDADLFWGQLGQPEHVHLKKYYRYASHTFVDGKGPLGSVIQLCDILAWNANRAMREGKKTPEFEHLLKTNMCLVHHGKKDFLEAANAQMEKWLEVDEDGQPYKLPWIH